MRCLLLGFASGVGLLQTRAALPSLWLSCLLLAAAVLAVWLHPERNSPEQLPRIGAALAELRCMPVDEIARITTANAHAALPRLQPRP